MIRIYYYRLSLRMSGAMPPLHYTLFLIWCLTEDMEHLHYYYYYYYYYCYHHLCYYYC
jgi:hypothetical protein